MKMNEIEEKREREERNHLGSRWTNETEHKKGKKDR